MCVYISFANGTECHLFMGIWDAAKMDFILFYFFFQLCFDAWNWIELCNSSFLWFHDAQGKALVLQTNLYRKLMVMQTMIPFPMLLQENCKIFCALPKFYPFDLELIFLHTSFNENTSVFDINSEIQMQ